MSPDGGVLCVLGTRPEAIKFAPVILALVQRGIATTICSTGQHRDMVRAALADFGIVADVDLDLMQPGQTPQTFVAAALPLLGTVLAQVRPAMVLVQGDTASTLAGAMAAAYARIKLGHVEAGLRSGAAEPFPEDMHRRLIAQLATHHFAPTGVARSALIREGVAFATIDITGNTVIDALHLAEKQLAADATLRERVAATLPQLHDGWPLVLVTAHRRENHARMDDIATAVGMLAAAHDIDVVVPAHPNPAAGTVLRRRLGSIANVKLVPPLDYFAFVTLLRRARLVLTDSGGVQEEAPALGCPILVLRDTTERPEGVEAGVAKLVGTDPARIFAAATALLDDGAAYSAMAIRVLPYGDGQSGERIAAIVAGEMVPA